MSAAQPKPDDRSVTIPMSLYDAMARVYYRWLDLGKPDLGTLPPRNPNPVGGEGAKEYVPEGVNLKNVSVEWQIPGHKPMGRAAKRIEENKV